MYTCEQLGTLKQHVVTPTSGHFYEGVCQGKSRPTRAARTVSGNSLHDLFARRPIKGIVNYLSTSEHRSIICSPLGCFGQPVSQCLPLKDTRRGRPRTPFHTMCRGPLADKWIRPTEVTWKRDHSFPQVYYWGGP